MSVEEAVEILRTMSARRRDLAGNPLLDSHESGPMIREADAIDAVLADHKTIAELLEEA